MARHLLEVCTGIQRGQQAVRVKLGQRQVPDEVPSLILNIRSWTDTGGDDIQSGFLWIE